MRRNRNFVIFWIAQGFSVAGDGITFVALPLLVQHETGSIARMGLLTAVMSVGSLVAGAFAGVLVDRWDRRRLMIICDVLRMVLYGAIPLIWLLSAQLWTLYLIVPIGAAVGMIFHVTYVTAVPNLVHRSQITAANGRLEATYAVATVGGIGAAGVLSAVMGPVAVIAVDAGTFAVSAAGLALIRWITTRDTETVDKPVSVSEFLAGAVFLWRNPVLRALTVLLSAQTFITLGMTDIFIYYIKHDLDGSDSVVGLVIALATVGAMLAGGLVGLARRTLGFGFCWIGAYALCGVAIALVGTVRSVLVLGLLAIVFTFCTSLAGTCSMSLRQEITPDRLLGRVTSAFWTVHSALGPLGAGLLTAMAGHTSVGAVCAVAGVACVVVALSGALTPLGSARPAGASPS